MLDNPLAQRGLIVLYVLLLIAVLVRLGLHLARRHIDDPERLHSARRIIRRIGFAAAVLFVASVFSTRISDFYTVLTVVGAGLAIAMRESLMSLAGRVYVATVSPYKRGDRIEINGVRGDVVEVRLFSTVMMEIGDWVDADQSTGRLVFVPNGWIFLYPLKNYSSGFEFVWNEFSITLTTDSNWETAEDILTDLASQMDHVQHDARKQLNEVAREYLVYYSILTPFVYVDIEQVGIKMTLRYLCDVRQRRGSKHAITVSFLEAIKERDDIQLIMLNYASV